MNGITHTSRKRSPSFRRLRRTPLSQPGASEFLGGLARCFARNVRTLVAVAAAGALATACVVDNDPVRSKPVPDPAGSVTFVVSAPRAAGSAATRAATRATEIGGGNAHFPDGVPADYRNYSEGADTVAYGTMFGGWPDAEAERAAFERAVEAMKANYEKSPAARTGSAAAGRGSVADAGNATRAIDEGSVEDNRIDELVIVRFDASGKYVDNILVGGDQPDEPVLTQVSADPTGERWSFTLEGLEDGNYRAVIFANSRSEVLAYIDAHDAAAAEPDPTMLTIEGFRTGLRVNHTMTATRPWNADPTDATDDANGVYRPFPMSSQPVDFSIPNTRDFSTWPIDLVRPLAKINIRMGEELREKASGVYKWEIEQVVVRNLNSNGRLVPAANFYRNADLLDDGAVNEQPGSISSLEYSFTPTWDVEDQIFVWEQLAGDDPITKTDWGQDEFCLLVKLDYYTITGTAGDLSGTDGAWFRIDLLKTVDPDAENPVRVNLLRNHTYDIEITAINTMGYPSESLAYDNAPSGLEFEIDAHDSKNGDPGMIDNTYNGDYQLTTDRSVLIVGPDAGDQATVMVYTDYSGGFRRAMGVRFISSEPEIITSQPANWPRSEQAMPLTFTVPVDYTGSTVRIAKTIIFAGELHKALTIVQLPDPARAAGDSSVVTDYVGAFWRADQTGERLIGLKPNVNWAAFVLGDNDWVVMDAKPSRDTRVNTDNPGMSGNDTNFDRAHNVESTVGWAAGTTGAAGGYFRIGLRGSHAATPEVPARYATVIVVEGTFPYQSSTSSLKTPRLLYLRQGHDADYLMRPEDGSGNQVLSSRPLAQRFSPYNLTAQAFMNGGTEWWYNVREWGDQSRRSEPVFADYPSQAGAQFRWVYTSEEVRAYRPYGFDDSWNNPYHNWVDWNEMDTTPGHPFGTIGDNYESCPPGYRRPSFSPLSNAPEVLAVSSETSQSLFSNPVASGTNPSTDNSVWGYYADGWFDRRELGSETATAYEIANTAVSTGTPKVAFIGRLFYNPDGFNSLFFPAPGYIHVAGEDTDGRRGTGHAGFYWSSNKHVHTSAGVNYHTAWVMEVNESGIAAASHYYYNYGGGYSIRCVKEPEFEPLQDLALAPPGVIGIKHSELAKPVASRSLTIRGSSTYEGTDVERYMADGPDFADMGGLESEPVYVVYFKWGSTVAMLGGPDHDQYDPSDLAWVQPGYTGGTDWGDVTSATDTGGSRYNIPVDYSYASLAKGWGDPCDLVGGHTPDNPSGWKTPIGAPWTYSDREQRSTPFGTGLGDSWDAPTVAARWKNIVAGGKTIGGAGTDNGRLWLVAAGYRQPGGEMLMNNTHGDYWAATVFERGGERFKSELGFDDGEVSGSGELYVTEDFAMPVRCVTEPLYIYTMETKPHVSYHAYHEPSINNTTTGEKFKELYPKNVRINVTTNTKWEVADVKVYSHESEPRTPTGTLLPVETAAVNADLSTYFSVVNGNSGTDIPVLFTPPYKEGRRFYEITFRLVDNIASTYVAHIFWQWGGKDEYLYLDTSTKKLALGPYTTSMSNSMIFTKFGGTVGFTGSGSWSGSQILFDPTLSVYGDYTLIPEYTGGAPSPAWDSPMVSRNDYHTLANVLAGRGDICRLVGMTVSDILNFNDDTDLYAAESGYRLPTDYENRFFVAGYSDSPNYDHSDQDGGSSTRGNLIYPYPQPSPSFGNPAIAWVPAIKGPSHNGAGMRLPALGGRSATGGPMVNDGQDGSYWSSTPKSADVGAALRYEFRALYTSQAISTDHGFAIRCVKSDNGQ